MECKSVRWQHRDQCSGSDVSIRLVFWGNHSGMRRNPGQRKNMDKMSNILQDGIHHQEMLQWKKREYNESMNKFTEADLIMYLKAIESRWHSKYHVHGSHWKIHLCVEQRQQIHYGPVQKRQEPYPHWNHENKVVWQHVSDTIN